MEKKIDAIEKKMDLFDDKFEKFNAKFEKFDRRFTTFMARMLFAVSHPLSFSYMLLTNMKAISRHRMPPSLIPCMAASMYGSGGLQPTPPTPQFWRAISQPQHIIF